MAVTLPSPQVADLAAQKNFEFLASGITWPGSSIGQGTITGGSGGNIGQGTITGGPGGNIAATSITANELSVTQLSAITANMGTLTSGTITGATVRSGATGARWEGDAGGLRGYKADGTTLSFGINTADGSAIFSGTVAAGSGSSGLSNISGQVGTSQVADGAITVVKLNVAQLSAITANMGTLTSGTITGATIRTASSGSRVEMTSAGLKFYESDGTTVSVDLSAANSGLNLLAGSTTTPPDTRQINWLSGGSKILTLKSYSASGINEGNFTVDGHATNRVNIDIESNYDGTHYVHNGHQVNSTDSFYTVSLSAGTRSASLSANLHASGVGSNWILALDGGSGNKVITFDQAGPITFPGTISVAKLNSAAYVTSLPGSPADGDVIYYAADATNSVIWQLRWRSAARGGSGAWEFIGGPPLFAEITASQGTTSATYTNLGTTGPSVTVPLNGDYDVRFGADMEAVASQRARATVKLGGTAAGDGECVTAAQGNPAGAAQGSSASRVLRLAGRSASDVLLVQYRVDVGGTNATFFNRFISVTPARVW